jgi:hypothetical protein
MNPEYQVEACSRHGRADRYGRVGALPIRTALFPTPSLEHSELMIDSMMLAMCFDDVRSAALLFFSRL